MPLLVDPQGLVGTFRRFGELGPAYEITKVEEDHGEVISMRVRIPSTGEELTYPLERILEDPRLA